MLDLSRRRGDPFPFNGNAAEGPVGNLVEGRGREVEISQGTASTTVRDSDNDGLALVGCSDLFATQGILVGVAAFVTRVCVEHFVGGRSDEITVTVRDTAGTESSVVEGACSSLDAEQEVDASAGKGYY